FYLGADLLAFPGLGEALGLVYLEAAAAGLPVVACAGPGPAAMVAPEGGLLTAATPAAFAAGLGALLADPARRQAMGAAAGRFGATERGRAASEARLKDGLSGLGLPGAARCSSRSSATPPRSGPRSAASRVAWIIRSRRRVKLRWRGGGCPRISADCRP